MEKEELQNKRGWVFDQLMIVGQLEAGMNHNDEEICNIRSDMENHPDDQDFLEDKAEELMSNAEIIALDYENRVDTLNQIFDAIPFSDRHYYCQIKHRAAAFVQAAENYHARNCCSDAEETLVRLGKSLALTCSLAFGFEPLQCLRCLDEAVNKVAPQSQEIVSYKLAMSNDSGYTSVRAENYQKTEEKPTL